MLQSLFYQLIINFIILHHHITHYQCYELSEKMIVQQLLNNYETASRPVKLGNKTLNTSIRVILQQVVDLDEKNQILLASLLVQLKWIDETIKYRILQLNQFYHQSYNNEFKKYFKSIVLPSSRVWTPDLYVYNNADDGKNGLLDVSQSRVRVNQEGEVTWNLPVSTRSSCNVDVLYFPFDHQLCNIQLASWTYDQSQLQLNIIPENTTVMLSKLIENVELAIPEVKIFKDYRITVGGQNITQINLRIHIYRRAVFYTYTVIAPSILLCVLTVFSFWLPTGNVRKIDMGLTVFLFLYFLQITIAENTPESNSTPLLGTFLTMVMTLNSVSLIFATIVLHIHICSKTETCPTPHPILWCFVTRLLGYLAMIPYKTTNQTIHIPSRYSQEDTDIDYNDNDDDDNDNDVSINNHLYNIQQFNRQVDTVAVTTLHRLTNTFNNDTSVVNVRRLNEMNISRWLYIARVVDRLLFQIYLSTTLISIFVFLIYLPISYDIKL
ncbi:Neuronal acetylcholine receptor subunit alpha-9-I [Schistosoma japonicum]|nr:Neuronal acetylcholine receptor subunit alpha-9-I [Schistosoma japonicum]